MDIAYALDKSPQRRGLTFSKATWPSRSLRQAESHSQAMLLCSATLPLGDARISIGWGHPGLSMEGNVYWWGGLFHGLSIRDALLSERKNRADIHNGGKDRNPQKHPPDRGIPVRQRQRGRPASAFSVRNRKGVAGGRVSFHVVFSTTASRGRSISHIPANPAFFVVNGIRVPIAYQPQP